MKTVKVYANISDLGEQTEFTRLGNVKKIHEGILGWSILLNCGAEVILPASTIFIIEDSIEDSDE